jgi:23S rRNA pseudouridine2605 synthase
MAADAGRALRRARTYLKGMTEDLTAELGPEFRDVDLRSLNPEDLRRQAPARGPRRRRARAARAPVGSARARPAGHARSARTSRPPGTPTPPDGSRARARSAPSGVRAPAISGQPARLAGSDRVISSSTFDAVAVGSDSTSGAPLSPPSRSRTSIGIWPSSGTGAPSRWTASWPPPGRRRSRRPRSTRRSAGTPGSSCSRRRRRSAGGSAARSSRPARPPPGRPAAGWSPRGSRRSGTSWATEMATSPVPGGRSISSTSRSPQ